MSKTNIRESFSSLLTYHFHIMSYYPNGDSIRIGNRKLLLTITKKTLFYKSTNDSDFEIIQGKEGLVSGIGHWSLS